VSAHFQLGARVDEIDVQIDKVHRLIDSGSRKDPELAAGLASGEDLGSVQRKIDQAAAACEALDGHVRDLMRG
jgi:hypothetical protein